MPFEDAAIDQFSHLYGFDEYEDALEESREKIPEPFSVQRDGQRYCAFDGCEKSIKWHYWSKVKATGWFLQKNGAIWCPDHVPEWVEEWRETQRLKKEWREPQRLKKERADGA